MKYVCDVCGWEFDERIGDAEHGIDVPMKFEDLPDDFRCPLCGVGKDQFSPAEQKYAPTHSDGWECFWLLNWCVGA